MEEDLPEFPLNEELQCSKTEVMHESPQDLKLDCELQDQHNQSPNSLRQDQEQQSLGSGLDQVQVPDKDTQDEEGLSKPPPDPPQDRLQDVDQNPAEDACYRGRVSCEESEQSQELAHRVDLDLHRVLPQDPDRTRHRGLTGSDQDQDQHQHQVLHQDQDQSLTTAAGSQVAVRELGGSVPALVVTQAEKPPALDAPAGEPHGAQRPADLVTPVIPSDPSLSCGSDGGDMSCSDLLSLRSDSLSLASEPTVSRMSEDDDSRSVTASSVMSLFHRVQLDPLERAWWRSSAVGNMAAQRQLLAQDSSLVLKKDFVTGFTALHWAAKQGRQDAVDMMLRSGADVNARSHGGYTALHLASIHGHQQVVHALIHTHNAKTSIRDYHGRTALHYWSGSSDIFNRADSQSGARLCRGRRTQRFILPSLLLSRSRSQGQLNLEFGAVPQSQDALDLQL